MSKKKLETIRKRHKFFKDYFNAKPTWRAELSVDDLDFLIGQIDKLALKLKKQK